MTLPAHATKHIPLLTYPFRDSVFRLSQHSDGQQNGTALWLGGQCLALYLAAVHARLATHGASAIELGSGVGLTALALCSLGWDVVATDQAHVVNAVLATNVAHNATALQPGSGKIQTRELDWTVSPDRWHWDNPASVTSAPHTPCTDNTLLQPPFDLIFSADTIYSRELLTPFLRTVHSLSTTSHAISGRCPIVLVCIEKRDPALLASLLEQASQEWHFAVERIPRTKLSKCIDKSGLQWDKEDWEGVEIWKLRLSLKP